MRWTQMVCAACAMRNDAVHVSENPRPVSVKGAGWSARCALSGQARRLPGRAGQNGRGAGAAPSANDCSAGRSVAAGHGGDGGVMDSNCTIANFTAANGVSGNDAAYVNGNSGKGGSGGSGCGV